MSNWSHLHWSMLNLVATNLTHVADHLAFSGVCSSWRSVALDIRPTFPCPLPHLMVRGENEDAYCISLSDKIVLNPKLSIPREDFYIGTYGGWLVTVHKNVDMSLYNPFSRETFPLPSMTSVPNLGEADYPTKNNIYVQSAALSSSNANVSPKDLTVMIIQGAYKRLAFAKPGDSSWQIIYNDECLYHSGVAFYKGKFYAVGKEGTVVCDIGLNPKALLIVPGTGIKTNSDLPLYECIRCYLVESQSGELIMVERWIDYNEEVNLNDHLMYQNNNDNSGTDDSVGYTTVNKSVKIDGGLRQSWTYMTMFFTTYKMDFVAQQWVPLEGIGDDQMFFVGYNTAFSLKAKSGQGNRVYYTDDYAEGQECEIMDYGKLYTKDIGVFNFSDRTIKPLVNIGGAALFPPPMWAIPLPW